MEWFLAYLMTTPALMFGAFTVGALMGRPFFRNIPGIGEYLAKVFPKASD